MPREGTCLKYGWKFQVLLQNCHLATSWMPTLATMVRDLQSNPQLHPDFRLWLTAMPSPNFPVSILQQGIKVTMEPPCSLRSNVLASLHSLPEETALACPGAGQEWRCLLYAAVLFHAAVQERRKFGPLGWNVPYDFADGDLACSLQTIQNLLEPLTSCFGSHPVNWSFRSTLTTRSASGHNQHEHIPWKAIRYVIGEINYGGRVTDDNDRILLVEMLEIFVNPTVLSHESAAGGSSAFFPMPSTICDCMAAVIDHAEGLATAEQPQAFGLHANAAVAYQLKVMLPFRY
jgi:dynein heavy chain, axonemal